MVSRETLQLLTIVTAGVFLGNILSRDIVLSSPLYLWHYCNNIYSRSRFNNKYKKYLTNNLTDFLTQLRDTTALYPATTYGQRFNIVASTADSLNPQRDLARSQDNKKGRNILVLCHGRIYPIVYTDLIDYQQDNVLTIDIDPCANPHLLLDLSGKECFKSIPDNCIDIIIFHSCDCCTGDVNRNRTLGTESSRILKKDGEVWIPGRNNANHKNSPKEVQICGSDDECNIPVVSRMNQNNPLGIQISDDECDTNDDSRIFSGINHNDFKDDDLRVIWLHEYFDFIKVLTSNKDDFMPKLHSYNYGHEFFLRGARCNCKNYLHVWRNRVIINDNISGT